MWGVSKSIEADDHKFVVHVNGEPDLIFNAGKRELRDEIITALKQSYFYAIRNNLPIYGIPTTRYQLSDYV